MVGEDGEEEAGAGHVLHVVPLPDEEEAAGGAADVAAVGVQAEAGAHVVLASRSVLL